MSSFILTWNPDNWHWEEFDAGVAASAAGKTVPSDWSTGTRTSGISPGDSGFMLRQGRFGRGLVASGTFTSEIYQAEHWDGSGRLASYANIDFDMMLPVADRLEVAELKRAVPAVSWDRLQGSGVRVPISSEADLLEAWQAHVSDAPWQAPEEMPPGTYEEGAVTRVEVNRYERDRAARQACIRHHGTTCTVCGFDFGQRYGNLGRDFIHVHHVREISTLGPNYKVDPKKDLVPLCANCHSMVHRQRPALTPQQLKKRLRG